MLEHRVLVLHNRYRVEGGEERSVALHMGALAAAGIEARLLERDSGEASRRKAASALLRGGADLDDVAAAVADMDATVVHAHNVLPLLGPRALGVGPHALLHLHNLRIFCATGFGERDGAPCELCHHRHTVSGVRHNCRGSRAEALVYATALARWQPYLIDTVDRFVAPTRFAAEEVVRRGLPVEKVDTLPHYVPDEAFAEASRAGEGEYLLVASRLSPEKGIDAAIAAADACGAPLRIAGAGPDADRLVSLAEGKDVTFLGKISPAQVADELDGAAAVLMPSRYHEFSPYSAIEALARGVPVACTPMGGLPELLGTEPEPFADRVATLWGDRALRQAEGERVLARARERHSIRAHIRGLFDLYGRLAAEGGH